MPGVVIELKAAEDETEDLAALAEETRRQIDTREYTTEMLAGFDHFPPHIPRFRRVPATHPFGSVAIRRTLP